MYWDRFDIVEAYFLYHMLWHDGQWGKLYALSGTFAKLKFTPRPGLSGVEDLTENAQEIYYQLEHGFTEVRDRREDRSDSDPKTGAQYGDLA